MKYRISLSIKKNSYTENGVDERIVATIAHGNPVTNEKYHVDIFIAVKGKKMTWCLKITEKVSFNIASEASYVYKSSRKNAKMVHLASL